jgi:hypothetical protein
MKPMRLIVLSSFLTIAFIYGITYTACKKDACNNVVCDNKGTCDGGKCTCPVGYEGPTCDTLSRNKFVFTYSGGDMCDTGKVYYTQYQIHLVAIPTNPLEMTMRDFLNNPDDSATCTMQSTDSFTFIGANNSTTYPGWGKLSNDSLWMTYSVEHDTTTYTCSYFGQSLRAL